MLLVARDKKNVKTNPHPPAAMIARQYHLELTEEPCEEEDIIWRWAAFGTRRRSGQCNKNKVIPNVPLFHTHFHNTIMQQWSHCQTYTARQVPAAAPLYHTKYGRCLSSARSSMDSMTLRFVQRKHPHMRCIPQVSIH